MEATLSTTSSSTRSSVVRSRSARVGAALLLSGVLVGGMTEAVSAQSTVLAPVKITINAVGTVPAGLTGYRVDAICKDVAGIPAPGNQTLTGALGTAGGSITLNIAVQSGTACQFRLTAQGTGPRPINGNQAFVGGIVRAVTFPTTVGGVAVDPNTVMETGYVPIEAPTEAVFGTLTPATTTSTSSTSTSTTSTTRPATTTTVAPTTSTTRPVTTVATLPPPVATLAPVTVPGKVITRIIVRDRKCRAGYRFSKSRCLTTAERKRYVK